MSEALPMVTSADTASPLARPLCPRRKVSGKGAKEAAPQTVSDENGNVLSPSGRGIPAGHPTTTEVRVELEDVGGRTKMVMTHAGVPADSPGAAGRTMALDKLAAHVDAHSGR